MTSNLNSAEDGVEGNLEGYGRHTDLPAGEDFGVDLADEASPGQVTAVTFGVDPAVDPLRLPRQTGYDHNGVDRDSVGFCRTGHSRWLQRVLEV